MPNFDFLSHCRPGMVLKTKDRREVRIEAVDAATGTISGLVKMFGPCAWTAEGRFQDAPAGAAGPLDLAPPVPETAAVQDQATRSLAEALNDPTAKTFCCD